MLHFALGARLLASATSAQSLDSNSFIDPPAFVEGSTSDYGNDEEYSIGTNMTIQWSTSWDVVQLGICHLGFTTDDGPSTIPEDVHWGGTYYMGSLVAFEWEVDSDSDWVPRGTFNLDLSNYFALVVRQSGSSSNYFRSQGFHITDAEPNGLQVSSPGSSSTTTVSASASTSSTSITSPPATASSATTSDSLTPTGTATGVTNAGSRQALSKGAKIGLGVGLGVGLSAAVLIGRAVFWILRRRRREEVTDYGDKRLSGSAAAGGHPEFRGQGWGKQ